MVTLRSTEDSSANFVEAVPGSRLFLESRYVRRKVDEVICYLSTQTGCNQGCRMCHLTQTGQTAGTRDATIGEVMTQAEKVLEHYRREGGPGARVVNFNFMARGEPLLAFGERLDGYETLDRLSRLAIEYGLAPRFKVSTIIPRVLRHSLEAVFPVIHPDIYWSVYSVSPYVRRRWLPNAMGVPEAVELLKGWQEHSHKEVRIHYAVIEGVNDTARDVEELGRALEGLFYAVNIVRYNPPGASFGQEGNFEQVVASWRYRRVRTVVVPRVGPDVYASCGMFYAAEERRS